MTSDAHPLSQSATHVAAAFFAALHGGRWNDAVALVDEQARIEFHDSEVASLLARAQRRADYRRMRDEGGGVGYSPDSSANAVLLAEYGEMPVKGIEGIATIADFAALSPAEDLARHLEAGNGPLHRFPPSILARMQAHAKLDPEIDLAAIIGTARERPKRRVIGEVHETIGADRIAHVIYRPEGRKSEKNEHSDGADSSPVEVLHLRDRAGWHVLLSPHDFKFCGTHWFEPDYDWEPGGGSPDAR
jgi:hypothetical protein